MNSAISVQDIAFQLQRFVSAMARYHVDCKESLEPTRNLFPIEVDLSQVREYFLSKRSTSSCGDSFEIDLIALFSHCRRLKA